MTDKKELKDLLNKALRDLVPSPFGDSFPTKEIIEKAYHLIKLGADPLTASSRSPQYNILNHLIIFGDVEWFKKFWEEFEFDNLDGERSNAFDFAIDFRKSEIVRFLIQKQNISQERIQNGFSKICTTNPSNIEETIELAKVLIENGAKIFQKKWPKEDLAFCASYFIGDNAFRQFLKKEREKEEREKEEREKEEREKEEREKEEREKEEREKEEREKEEKKVKNNIPSEKVNQNTDTFMKDNLALIQTLNILAIKNGELTKYNEELAKKNEELAKQNKELVKQNEELNRRYTELEVQMQILQYES